MKVTLLSSSLIFFFFNDPTPTNIYTLSLHDALPIFLRQKSGGTPDHARDHRRRRPERTVFSRHRFDLRSEEHTSELQSPDQLVCRLLLEKKKVIVVNANLERGQSAPREQKCPVLIQI